MLSHEDVLAVALRCFTQAASYMNQGLRDGPEWLGGPVDELKIKRAEGPMYTDLQQQLQLIDEAALSSQLTPATVIAEHLVEYARAIGFEHCLQRRVLHNEILVSGTAARAQGTVAPIKVALAALLASVKTEVDTVLNDARRDARKKMATVGVKRLQSELARPALASLGSGTRDLRGDRAQNQRLRLEVSDDSKQKAADIARQDPRLGSVCFAYVAKGRACPVGDRCRRAPCNGRLAKEFQIAEKAAATKQSAGG